MGFAFLLNQSMLSNAQSNDCSVWQTQWWRDLDGSSIMPARNLPTFEGNELSMGQYKFVFLKTLYE